MNPTNADHDQMLESWEDKPEEGIREGALENISNDIEWHLQDFGDDATIARTRKNLLDIAGVVADAGAYTIDEIDAWIAEVLPTMVEYPEELVNVMTATEVAETYNLTERGIRATCERGSIPARKSGATWLIRREDAQAKWGK